MDGFPSPVGVLLVSINGIYATRDDLAEFPSPVGVLLVSILGKALKQIKL